MMHFHKWEELWDVYFDANQILYEINRIYRHCKACNKWQRYHSDWGEDSWTNSALPIGYEMLISKKQAKIKIEEVKMRQESENA